MKRFDCLKILASHLIDELAVVALGGVIDEWHSCRPDNKNLYLKAMGAVTPVAFGLSGALLHRKVISIDTDGSMLLNMGILATLGNERPKNLIVLILDNECYEVIGLAPTHTAKNVDLAKMAHGAGIPNVATVRTLTDFEEKLKKALNSNELNFIVLKLEPGSEVFPEEKRKRTNGEEDKYNFVRHIEDLENVTIIPREVKSIRKIETSYAWNK